MRVPSDLRPARDRDGVRPVRVDDPDPELNRRLYREIGRDHHWLDRAAWRDDAWARHVAGVETWVAEVEGAAAGLSELRRAGDGSVDVQLFGVRPAFQGRGVGGVLLTAVVRRGWAMGAGRVTVDTCELDGPHALANYRARGFELVRETIVPRRRSGGPVARLRDIGDGEAAALEDLQQRASLVWEEYRARLEAHPEVVALPARGRLRVAVDEDDRPVGFSVVVAREGGAWELDGLFVEPGHQRTGVGSVLVADVLGRAQADGVTRIDVVAGPARGFYERLGFVVVGEAETRFGPALELRRAVPSSAG
jgi:GNAT superfamily N-acetyltransferase